MAYINLYKTHSRTFLLALTTCKIFTFQISPPWKCRSKSWCTTFAVEPFDRKYLTSYLIVANTCQNSQLKFGHENLCKGYGVQLLHINLHKCHNGHFRISSYCLQNINILTFWPWKFRSWSCGRRTGHTPFDSEYQPAYKSYAAFLL